LEDLKSKGEASMLSTILRTGSYGLGLVLLVAVTGCQPQNQNGATTTSLSAPGADGGALVNQGRFPAPIYDQEAQPAYALTGDQPSQDTWASLGHYFQVGNDRISFPAAP
jgi:hypothetical protein